MTNEQRFTRERIATAAMAGLLASRDYGIQLIDERKHGDPHAKPVAERCAIHAVACADALIAALSTDQEATK